jgi:hypothetical protein
VTPEDTGDAEAQTRRLAGVRTRLSRSPLARSGGLLRTRVTGLDLPALVQDALDAHRSAVEARVAERATETRGDPDRWLESAPGGPGLEAFVQSEAVLDTLIRATGVGWRPAGPGSWSYYRREGHHLGLHRDLAVCDLAVITCVVDQGGGDPDSGQLRLWPTRTRSSLDEIRSDDSGARAVRIRPGESVLLLGGFVAHQVRPLGPDHVRIVAPVCYQALPCDC